MAASVPNITDVLTSNGASAGVPGALGVNQPPAPTGAPASAPSAQRVDARATLGSNALLDALVKRGRTGSWKLELSDTDLDSLSQLVIRDFDDSVSAIDRFKQNMVEMQKNWRRTPTPKDFPFEGASNLMVPLTAPAVEQMKARMLKALWGDGELISELGQLDRELSPADVTDANRWFHWELVEVVKLRRILDRLLHQILVFGISLPIASYEHRTRVLHSLRHFPLSDEPIESQLSSATSQILGERSEWSADAPAEVTNDNGKGIHTLTDGGEIQYSITSDDYGGPLELTADIWRRETIFDGVRVTLTRLQDLALIPSAEGVDEIPFFGTRHFVSVQDYRERLDDGYYIDHGAEENARIIGMADVKIGDVMQRYEDIQADAEEGVDSSDATAYFPNRRWLEVYRWEGWFVPESKAGRGDGGFNLGPDRVLDQAIQVCAWVARRARKVIRVCLLEDLNKDGKRSPVKFCFISEPERFFPMGLSEWLRYSQSEIDSIHNQRIDAGTIMNVPFFFYDPASGFQKDVIKVKPGEGYPAKFTNGQPGVFFPRINWQPTASFQEEMLSDRYAGRQAGLSEPAMGQATSKRQSASEYVGVASAMDLRTERLVDDLLESLRELLYRILGLYQQFGPKARIYRLTGEAGLTTIKRFERDRLQGRLWLKLAGNLDQINEQLQRQLKTDVLSLLLNQILIQLGMVGPDTIYEAVTGLLKSMHLDYTIHKPDVPPVSDPPQLEGRQLFEGFEVKGPTMSENFSEHLTVHMRTDLTEWPPDAVQRMQEHIKATMQMQQQVQIMRQLMAAQAVQMAQGMAEQGVRPGKAGGQQAGEGAGRSATAAEVRGGEAGGGMPGGPTAMPSNPLGGV